MPVLADYPFQRKSTGNGGAEVFQRLATTQGVGLEVRWDTRGVLDIPAISDVLIAMHLGPAAKLACRREGKRFNGTAVHGDIDIIPAQTPMRWEMFDQNDRTLILSVPANLVQKVSEDFGVSKGPVRILNRFQVRDLELEKLSWAMKHEMEMGLPSGRPYLDGLTLAVVSRLLARHSSVAKKVEQVRGGLVGRRLKQVLSFIEDQLEQDLSLERIAEMAEISASHLNALFRQSVGVSVHQYLIQRRLERAKALLKQDGLSITEIALATGFAHPSHLARHMRRATGMTTRAIRRLLIEARR
jgi:AraC family transcriptional regulator